MIPIQRDCDVENLHDFARYYASSWVGWHPSDGAFIVPAFVGQWLGEDQLNLRFLSKAPGGGFTVGNHTPTSWTEVKAHIDFGIPDIGLYQDGPTIMYGSYASPRSPHKGYRPRNLVVSDFNQWAIRRKYTRSSRDSYDWVWLAFNPEHKTLAQALDLIGKGSVVGIPISRTIGIYTLPKFKYPLLSYKRWTVGYVTDAYTVYIKPQYADYQTEIARQTGAKVVIG